MEALQRSQAQPSPGRVLLVAPTAVMRRQLLSSVQQASGNVECTMAATPEIAEARLSGSSGYELVVASFNLGASVTAEAAYARLADWQRRWPKLSVIVLSSKESPVYERRIQALGYAVVELSELSRSLPTTQQDSDAASPTGAVRSVSSPRTRAGASSEISATEPKLTCPAPLGAWPAVKCVAIGASTGGPDALASVLSGIPASFPAPILVTQHMPRDMTAHLATSLSAKTSVRVKVAKTGAALDPGIVFLAPGDMHLLIRKSGRRSRIVLSSSEPVHRCRPAVDPMLLSAVDAFGRNLLAVILTGMGSDGLDGCRAVHKAGGVVVVQDKSSSVVWGMPGAVAKAGIAHSVGALDEIAPELVERAQGTFKYIAPSGVDRAGGGGGR